MSENFNSNFSNDVNNNDFGTTVSGVDVAPRKKKGKKIAVISGVTVAALGIGGVAAYNFSGLVKNQVNLRVMKPENYYAWVNEENAKSFAESAKENYSKALDKTKGGQGGSVSLKYVANDTVKELALQELIGTDYQSYQDDEAAKMLIDIINNINEIKVGSDFGAEQNAVSGTVFAELNGNALANLDMAFNGDTYDYFFRIPQLTEQWLGISLGDAISDITYDEDVNEILDAYNDFLSNPKDYLSPDELEDIIIRYSDIWNKTVEDIEVETNEDIDICDVTVNYTVMTVELDQDTLVDLAESFIKEAKNDKVIRGIVIDKIGVCSEDEYKSAFDELLDEVKGIDFGVDYTFKLETYVNSKGELKGGKLKAPMIGEIFCASNDDENEIRSEFSVTVNNEDIVSVELNADKDGNAYSGDVVCVVNADGEGYRLSADFSDYEVVNEDYGYINGKVTLNIPEVDPIRLNFSSNGDSQDVSYDLDFDGTNYGTVVLGVSVNDNASVELPDKSGAYVLDIEGSSFDLESYIPRSNMESFIRDILSNVGLSDELADEGAKAVTEGIYYEAQETDFDIEDYIY